MSTTCTRTVVQCTSGRGMVLAQLALLASSGAAVAFANRQRSPQPAAIAAARPAAAERAEWLTRFHMTLNSGPPGYQRWYQQDINGPITVNGTYHVFVLGKTPAGEDGWIHASSTDMVTWKNHGLTIHSDTGSISRAPNGQYVPLPSERRDWLEHGTGWGGAAELVSSRAGHLSW